MKQILSFVSAGIIGGLVTLGGFFLLNDGQQPLQPAATYVQEANYSPREQAPNSALPFDFKEAAEKAMPAVVHISAESNRRTTQQQEDEDRMNPWRFFFGDGGPSDSRPQRGSGSGVIYTQDGYIITNNHVIDFADEMEVTLYDNRTYQARLIGKDDKTDLAVIKIEANNLPALNLADSDDAEIGEWVLAVGNPFDLTSTVTAGIISAKGRSIQLLGGGDAIESFIQTDAAVNPGNSGGALVTSEGELVGINTAIATRTGVFSGYSFAIPVNLVKRIVDDIIEYGSYQRAFLGVSIFDLDSEFADSLNVSISQGVVVRSLFEGGSAKISGVKENDIIIKVNDRSIKNVPELQEMIGQAKVGETIELTVNRKGREIKIPVKLRPSAG